MHFIKISMTSITTKFCSLLCKSFWKKKFISHLPNPHNLILLFIWGAQGGIIFVATGSTLSIWLKEHGVSLQFIGLIAMLHLPYSLKFFWMPFIDLIQPPLVHRWFGKHLGWIFFTHILIFIHLTFMVFMSLFGMSFDVCFFINVFALVFWTATHDVFVMSCQRTLFQRKDLGFGETACMAGFRIGIIISGAGALAVSEWFSWSTVYLILSGIFFVLCGISLHLMLRHHFKVHTYIAHHPMRLMIRERFKNWHLPFQNFVRQHPQKWWIILLFMALYQLQDFTLSVMPTFFFMEHGISKHHLALTLKTGGLFIAMFGGYCGACLMRAYGYRSTLYMASMLHAFSMIIFICMAQHPIDFLFYACVLTEEMTKGCLMTVFFSYQLQCCQKHYIVAQMSLITGICRLSQMFMGSISGWLAVNLGWHIFFLLCACISLPGILCIAQLPMPDED